MMIMYGSTTNFVVFYDSSFTGGGQPDGPTLARGVLDYCEYDLVRLSMLFGGILPPASSLPIQINLVPGPGGASNNLVNSITCYCNMNTDPLGLPALVVAEEAEIFMSLQAKGWTLIGATAKLCRGCLRRFFTPTARGSFPPVIRGSMAPRAHPTRHDPTG
ncbi:MAG TPA: hypothetical protein VKB84_00215 [Candidatus Binataceae bacterium]|nr:hypothetical protein [Candidatus Binataceae bacterium]